MCLTAKASLFAFIILIVIAILLYIRNIKYDRIFASFILAVSLIQLTEYLFHSKLISSQIGGKMIFTILWFQVLVLAIGIQILYQTTLTSIWMILFTIIFIIALYYVVQHIFEVTTGYGHLIWSQQDINDNILGNTKFIYLLGLFVPLFIILYYSEWSDISMWIIIVTFILSILLVRWIYPRMVFSSLWCYSAVGVAFVIWLVGAFYEHKVK